MKEGKHVKCGTFQVFFFALAIKQFVSTKRNNSKEKSVFFFCYAPLCCGSPLGCSLILFFFGCDVRMDTGWRQWGIPCFPLGLTRHVFKKKIFFIFLKHILLFNSDARTAQFYFIGSASQF